MKAVVVCGSPRVKGNTQIILETACDVLKEKGVDTELVLLHNKFIKPCIACEKCKQLKDRTCSIKDDDFHPVLEKIIEADAFISDLPGGYNARLGERGANLSFGERQLLAFARALAFDPPVLILDEATSSVDSETEARIQRALNRLIADRTAIIVAHRLSTIRDVDRIIVLHHGEVREEGTHEELLASDGIYARLYRLQHAEAIGLG